MEQLEYNTVIFVYASIVNNTTSIVIAKYRRSKTYCTWVYILLKKHFVYSNEVGGALRGTRQGPVLEYL